MRDTSPWTSRPRSPRPTSNGSSWFLGEGQLAVKGSSLVSSSRWMVTASAAGLPHPLGRPPGGGGEGVSSPRSRTGPAPPAGRWFFAGARPAGSSITCREAHSSTAVRCCFAYRMPCSFWILSMSRPSPSGGRSRAAHLPPAAWPHRLRAVQARGVAGGYPGDVLPHHLAPVQPGRPAPGPGTPLHPDKGGRWRFKSLLLGKKHVPVVGVVVLARKPARPPPAGDRPPPPPSSMASWSTWAKGMSRVRSASR